MEQRVSESLAWVIRLYFRSLGRSRTSRTLFIAYSMPCFLDVKLTAVLRYVALLPYAYACPLLCVLHLRRLSPF
jgi:hypothetical protein